MTQNKQKCIICLFGLYRTFEITCTNIQKNIIDCNKDKFDFEIIINTDLNNINLAKWGNQVNNINYSKDELEEKLHNCYNNNNELIKILYLNAIDRNLNSCDYIRNRLKQIMEYLTYENKSYDLYIYLRMDCILTDSIDLNLFLNNPTDEMKKINIITSDTYCINRLDHWRDFDFCFISDKKGLELYFYVITREKNEPLDWDGLQHFHKLVDVKSMYIEDCFKENKIIYNDVYNYIWNNYYNLYKNNYLVKYSMEEKNIFCRLIR